MAKETTADFKAVFEGLKPLLKAYAKEMVVRYDNDSNYYIDTKQAARGKPVYFGSVHIKKNYVSLYVMPVYVYEDLRNSISPELQKRMQGKSCFNFTAVPKDHLAELKKIIRSGYELYKADGLV
jgi:hypothetical protein